MVQIPNVCCGDPATTVAAHANWLEYGKGMGIKAHDIYTAWACFNCHVAMDELMIDRDQAKEYWRRGFERTMLAIVEQGILKVA